MTARVGAPILSFLVLLAAPSAVMAQAQTVTAVLNQESGDGRLSPGVLADVPA